jgi:hypothetical protein
MCECVLDSTGSQQGPAIGSCEHFSEPSGSVKDGQYTD